MSEEIQTTDQPVNAGEVATAEVAKRKLRHLHKRK